MKEDFNYKEEKFRSILEDLDLDLDTNELWTNIQPRVKTNKSKNRFIFWWVGALVAIGFVSGFLVANYHTNSEIGTQANIELSKVHLLQQTENFNKEKTSNFETIVSVKSTATIEEKNKDLLNNSKSNTINKKVNVIHQKMNDEDAHFQDTNITVSESVGRVSEDLNQVGALEEFVSTYKVNFKQLPVITEDSKLISPLVNLPLIDSRLDFTRDMSPFRMTRKLKDIDLWKPYLTLAFGLNKNNTEHIINNTEYVDILNLQFDREQDLLGLTGLFTYGQEHLNGWRWNVGIFLNQRTSRYHNTDQDVVEGEVDGTNLIVIGETGIETASSGLIRADKIYDYDITWHRQHLDIDLQLGLGKKLIEAGSFSTAMDLNLAYNVHSLSSGYGFNAEALFAKVPSEMENPYANSNGLKAMVSIPFAYKFNKLGIELRPYYRTDLNEEKLNTNNYSLKNSQFGITLGVTYEPNWE